jgi:5-phospho-D-xylono-1,4-lactonase
MKVAGGFHDLDDHARTVLAAAARAHHATGAPIGVDHELGTASLDVLDLLAALVEAGHADRLLLGGDTTTAAARASTGGGPGMPYLLRVLRPRIVRDLGEAVAEKIFMANPARAFAVDWRR